MLYFRSIIPKISQVLLKPEFIILTGARQAGKTSILLILKDELEKKDKTCHFFNLENPDYLNAFNKHPFNIFNFLPDKKTKQFVFIDEIQYLDDPTNFLKLLFDEKKDRIKIIASGSSSFYIDKKFKDSLAGRKYLFEIFTLNFNEYLEFNGKNDLLSKKNDELTDFYRKELLQEWGNYLTYGGYPKPALEKNNDIKKLLIEEIGSSYVKKDTQDAGIKSTDKYFNLLKIIAAQTGQLLNIQELAKTVCASKLTIEEFIYVMKKSYQIALIKPFYKNLKKELTKMPKAYFYDLGLRNFFLGDFNNLDGRSDKGPYLENIIFREFLLKAGNLDKIKFWRTQDKKEIDFIINNNSAYEVKYSQDKVNPKKYEFFNTEYPEKKLEFLYFKNILNYFYGWKI